MFPQGDPSLNATAWLWKTLEQHDPALYALLREGHTRQQRIYNVWAKKERARKDLKQMERSIELNGGEERPGRYTLTHYRRRLAEYEIKLREMQDENAGSAANRT